jgi:hypothetical protein
MVLRILHILFTVFVLAGCSSKGAETVITDTCSDGTCVDGTADTTSGSTETPTTVSLAAVDGSGDGTTDDGSVAGGLVTAIYDDATGIFTVSGLGLSADLNRFQIADYRTMLAMRDASGTHNAYFGQGAQTQVIVYSGGTAGNVLNLASYGRSGASEMPLTGTAQFNGE